MQDFKRQIEERRPPCFIKDQDRKQQVKTARSIKELASRELKMAQDRFGAGLGIMWK